MSPTIQRENPPVMTTGFSVNGSITMHLECIMACAPLFIFNYTIAK